MFEVAVEFIIHPDHVGGFKEAVLRQSHNSVTREPACKQFDVCHDPNEATRFFLYELYDNSDAFAVHRKTEHFAQFQSTIAGMVKDKRLMTLERL